MFEKFEFLKAQHRIETIYIYDVIFILTSSVIFVAVFTSLTHHCSLQLQVSLSLLMSTCCVVKIYCKILRITSDFEVSSGQTEKNFLLDLTSNSDSIQTPLCAVVNHFKLNFDGALKIEVFNRIEKMLQKLLHKLEFYFGKKQVLVLGAF